MSHLGCLYKIQDRNMVDMDMDMDMDSKQH